VGKHSQKVWFVIHTWLVLFSP